MPKSKKPIKSKKAAVAIDWTEPFPPASDETLIRASVTQLLIVNGVQRQPGTEVIIDSAFAHQHASALGAPAPLIEE